MVKKPSYILLHSWKVSRHSRKFQEIVINEKLIKRIIFNILIFLQTISYNALTNQLFDTMPNSFKNIKNTETGRLFVFYQYLTSKRHSNLFLKHCKYDQPSVIRFSGVYHCPWAGRLLPDGTKYSFSISVICIIKCD